MKDMVKDRITRRKLLKLGGAGLAGVTLSDPVLGKSGDYVEVPRAKNRNGVTETRLVPKEWYRHLQRVLEMMNRRRHTLHNPGVLETSVVRSNTKFGGVRGFEIEIGVDPEGVNGKIPHDLDGIPINTITVGEQIPLNCRTNMGEYSSIPGGVDGNGGTTTCMVYWNGYEPRIMNAAHTFDIDSNCNLDSGETDFHQGSYEPSDPEGEITQYDTEADWALAKITANDTTYSDKIKTVFDSYPVHDIMSETEVAWLMDEYEHVYKMGKVTGTTNGIIDKMNRYYYSGCITMEGKGIHVTADAAEGDSGGPGYIYRDVDGDGNDEIRLVNFVSVGPAGYEDGWECDGSSRKYDRYVGTAFYYLNNKWGIAV
ncbi:MAG: hypothetical protein SXQ77_13025 [Halobacteria archaeon]|nr:hypothetical protein [Halobacteria archaeon]